MTDREAKLAEADRCRKAGQLDQAERLCRELLALAPADAEVLRMLSAVLGQRGDLDQAERWLREAARLSPDSERIAQQLRHLNAVQQLRLGFIFEQQGRFDEATASLRRAIELAPGLAEAHQKLGLLFASRGQFAEAADSFEQVARLKPRSPEAFYNLGLAQQKQGLAAEAEANYRLALELKPDYPDVFNNLAIIASEDGRPEEAESLFARALAAAPDYAEAHANLAELLLKRNRPAEAERSCRRALATGRNRVSAEYELAVMLAAQNKLDEAADGYRKAIALAPDYVDAHVGLATVLLTSGDFAAGWPEYEWRLQHPDMPSARLPRPVWRGESLADRTILVRPEQGAGDAIQFIRYAPLVKQQGCRVLVGCKPNLRQLLSNCAGVDTAVVATDALPAFDFHVPLLSVPGLLGTTLETIPADVPYLHPQEASIAAWRDELSEECALKVGIAWQGNRSHRRDLFRSIPLSQFARVARVTGARLYSLQFGAGAEQLDELAGDWGIVDFADRLGDFDHTAALVHNLDLVISCDSAPAHLAGALGVPVWLALAYAADWRWLVNRSDSPWYPTMRIFRQSQPGDWEGVLARMAEELGRLVAARETTD